jgi:hypothetical protein
VGFCITLYYGYLTNIPGGFADANTSEENELGGDEEAEVSTSNTQAFQARTLSDPTGVYQDPTLAYYVTFTFYRRPADQGKAFTLYTEFELLDRVFDTQFDVVVTTQRNDNF